MLIVFQKGRPEKPRIVTPPLLRRIEFAPILAIVPMLHAAVAFGSLRE